VTLHEAPIGASIEVADNSQHPRARRLAELGLRRGAEVQVLRRTSGGGRLLGIGTARLAVDKCTAASVRVHPR
jgi:ferrous iron transport protein A